MVRSLHMMAAAAALALAAETGSGSGRKPAAGDPPANLDGQTADPSGQADRAPDDLVLALQSMTLERDEALAAGVEAITELQNLLAAAEAARDSAIEQVAGLRRDLDQERADRSALAVRCAELDRLLAAQGPPTADRLATTAPRLVEDHYVLRTSRLDDGLGATLARGRIVTVPDRKARRLLAQGKLRPATVAEVEKARHEIVSL